MKKRKGLTFEKWIAIYHRKTRNKLPHWDALHTWSINFGLRSSNYISSCCEQWWTRGLAGFFARTLLLYPKHIYIIFSEICDFLFINSFLLLKPLWPSQSVPNRSAKPWQAFERTNDIHISPVQPYRQLLFSKLARSALHLKHWHVFSPSRYSQTWNGRPDKQINSIG